MPNNLLLNSKEFEIDEFAGDVEQGEVYCKKLIEKWTLQLETEMLKTL